MTTAKTPSKDEIDFARHIYKSDDRLAEFALRVAEVRGDLILSSDPLSLKLTEAFRALQDAKWEDSSSEGAENREAVLEAPVQDYRHGLEQFDLGLSKGADRPRWASGYSSFFRTQTLVGELLIYNDGEGNSPWSYEFNGGWEKPNGHGPWHDATKHEVVASALLYINNTLRNERHDALKESAS